MASVAAPVPDTDSILEELRRIREDADITTVSVACSGGVDSMVLLHLMDRICRGSNHSLTALHVNHGIDPNSNLWEEHCRIFCQTLGIDFRSTRLDLSKCYTKVNENKTRQLRYGWLAQQLSENAVLLTAHHQDDQAETLLLNLMRGSGVRGLAGMRTFRRLGNGYLLRPLLKYSRNSILHYAKCHQLSYIEDSSNLDVEIRRNFLRHITLPSLTKHWPSGNQIISRAANILSDARDLLDQLAQIDLETCQVQGVNFFCTGKQISAASIAALPKARQINLIRFWIRTNSIPEPNQKVIKQILGGLKNGSQTFGFVQWSKYRVYLYQQILYLSMIPKVAEHSESIQWNLKDSVEIPTMGMQLTVRESAENAICREKLNGEISIRFRRGGERIILPNRNHSSSLKKLFQQHLIPPWERNQLPLIYCNEEMVAVVPWLTAGKFRSERGQTGIRAVIEKLDEDRTVRLSDDTA